MINKRMTREGNFAPMLFKISYNFLNRAMYGEKTGEEKGASSSSLSLSRMAEAKYRFSPRKQTTIDEGGSLIRLVERGGEREERTRPDDNLSKIISTISRAGRRKNDKRKEKSEQS
jgi:hypothetical protein